MSLSYQGVEMLAELWLGNLYVYQVIITPEIGNCPPVVHCTMEKLEGRGGQSFQEPLFPLVQWLLAASVMLLAFK